MGTRFFCRGHRPQRHSTQRLFLSDRTVQIDRVFTSPGPVYEPHLSEDDVLWARAFFAAGIGPKDIALNAFSYQIGLCKLIASLLHPDQSMNRIYRRMMFYGHALFLPRASAPKT